MYANEHQSVTGASISVQQWTVLRWSVKLVKTICLYVNLQEIMQSVAHNPQEH